MELPDEIVELILSYGDVVVTQRYCGVIRQLNYISAEFYWQNNHNTRSIWYYRPPGFYPVYILMKNIIKKNLNDHIDDYLNNSYVMRFIGTEAQEQLIRMRHYMSYEAFVRNDFNRLGV
jgi:hypothetical protein